MNYALEWLKAAKDDLILLEDIKNNSRITNLIAFHSQQAMEKSLKALLEYQNKKIPKTHKLQTLVDLIESDLGLNDDLIQLLDEIYIDSRYPTEFGLLPYGKPTLQDAKEFYLFAANFFNKVCAILEINKSELI